MTQRVTDEQAREAIESWKAWHREVVEALGLRVYERQVTLQTIKDARAALAEREAECADMRKALDAARAHARGVARRENGLKEALSKAESTIQSFKDRLANSRAEVERLRKSLGRISEGYGIPGIPGTLDPNHPSVGEASGTLIGSAPAPPSPATEGCERCGGAGAVQVRVVRTVAAHDPNCDGRCLNCPVPTPVEDYEVEPCPSCQGPKGGE